jgi:hypothetical protein
MPMALARPVGCRIVWHFVPQILPKQTPMNNLHIRQSRGRHPRGAPPTSKERPMPIRGFAVSTILSVLTVVAAGSHVAAQTREQPRLGAPPPLRSAVAGLPEQEPAFTLAQLAIESNQWTPCCEPPSPTKGLWGGCPPSTHSPSWQECYMSFRDGLSWVFTRPVCNCNMTPPSDASAWDWLTQWMPTLGSVSTGMSHSGGAACEFCP